MNINKQLNLIPERDIPASSLTNNNTNYSYLQAQTLNTISNMEVGNKEYKKYYIMNYISEVQRERVGPLADLQREIVVMNSHEDGYYQSK